MTNENDNVLKEISDSGAGVMFSDEDVTGTYFFEKLYNEPELEKYKNRNKVSSSV